MNAERGLRPGDRVRVSFEGAVVERKNGGDYVVWSTSASSGAFFHKSVIELLPPELPTTAGSVIKIEDGTYLALQQDGLWCDESTEKTASHWFEVVFDAGAK